MKPRLVGISGPMKGEIVSLSEGEITLGRDVGNRVQIPDPMVSRRHCLVRGRGDRYSILDLESRNGTLVNEVNVRSHQLAHADRIRIGTSLFVFLLHEMDPEGPGSNVLVEDSEFAHGTTVQLRAEDALYLQPEKALSLLPVSAIMARDLTALLKISTTINTIRRLEDLHQQVLELIFEVVPAERGAILLTAENKEGFSPVFGADRNLGPDQTIRVSRTVVRKVLAEGVSLMRSNAPQSGGLASSDSIAAYGLRSILCVPLSLFGRLQGAIYLDSTDPANLFREDHLQLVTAIAGIAAVALENLRHLDWLESEKERLQADLDLEFNMLGESPAMREVYLAITNTSRMDSNIFLWGEGGSGKGLIARAIHQSSERADRPFVAVTCTGQGETLLDAQLFGEDKVSLSGAVSSEKGSLEVARKGTLFLDEVGALSPPLQQKLLRVLMERGFERIGGAQRLETNVRIIAATCLDIEKAVRDGGFNADLYHTLNVASIRVPPLRERSDDIVLLANYFAARYSQRCKRKVLGISPEARELLIHYDWPGNVRELKNAIERAVALGCSDWIVPEDLPNTIHEMDPPPGLNTGSYYDAVREAKRKLVEKALEQAGGNHVTAARLLGLRPSYFHQLVQKLNIPRKVRI